MTPRSALLPNLPHERILARYRNAPGRELEHGKFASPNSSAALAANTFGMFLDRPGLLPPLPGLFAIDWTKACVDLECEVRFPWRGGRHPWLDVLVTSERDVVGIESKRYEPYRGKHRPIFSAAFTDPARPWPAGMEPYQRLLTRLMDAPETWAALDAAQLVKHALALATLAGKPPQRTAALVYLFAEPTLDWVGRVLDREKFVVHRDAVERFARAVEGATVRFHALTYRELLAAWASSDASEVAAHALAVRRRFDV